MDLVEHNFISVLTSVIVTLLASSGFWAMLEYRFRKRDTTNKQREMQTDLLLGLAHDRIVYLGLKYIRRGCITTEEYENLMTYLYKPYKAMDGNGSAERVIMEVMQLPIKPLQHLIGVEDLTSKE